MKRKCPTCNSSEGVRIIIWGMPAGEPDESKYYIGGCLIEDKMPDYKCITCGWEGFKLSVEGGGGGGGQELITK